MSSAAVRSKPFIRETTLRDIAELAVTMREEDRMEVSFSSGGSPLDALMDGYLLSDQVATIEANGRVVAIFGVCGTTGSIGCPWMLGADGLEKCRSLLRECRTILQGYTEEYHYLTNACWSKNVAHVDWIKWLGFTFEGSSVRNGETFLHFHKEHLCAT